VTSGRERIRGVLALLSALVALAAAPAAPGAATAAEPTEAAKIEVGHESTAALASGPEGSVYFVADGMLGRVGADGTVSETKLSEGVDRVEAATAGPEGDIWVTTRERIDRIAPDGTVTGFGLPKGSGEAGAIAVTADGTAWATTWAPHRHDEEETGPAYVVRVGGDGKVTRIALPGADRRRFTAPGSIVAGPGGEAWFTDPSLRKVGRIAADGTVTEYGVRLAPEVLTPDGPGKLWFVGVEGVGTIDAGGKVEEVRVGNFGRISLGGDHGAVAGPEGDLWLIGEATRVLRVTPSGHVDEVLGTGTTAAGIVASGGSIWVGTIGSYKGFQGPGPILRYTAGLPGIEVRPGTAVVDGAGKVAVHLSCGGSSSGCEGEVKLHLEHGEEVVQHYAVGAEAEGEVSLALPAGEAKLLRAHGYERVWVSADGAGAYGGSTELILRAARTPVPRAGAPVVMPLPEDVGVAGLAAGPGRTLWTGGDVGRLNRVGAGGQVSTVDVPGLEVQPLVIGSDAHRDVWFEGSAPPWYAPETEPVVGFVEPDGTLWQRQLPAGPAFQDAAVGADGEAWVLRGQARRRGVIERVARGASLKRFKVGAEARAIAVGGDGAWFAEKGPKVVHIDRAGKRHVFSLGTGGTVESIALGKGGAVWLGLGRHGGKPAAIARLYPDGKLARHEVEGVGEVGTLLVDRKGRLWFSSEFPRRIGTMTPAGKVKLTRRGAAAGAGAVTLGPGGDVWFGDYEQETLAGFRP
jgi:virginiamycin B lyase